MAVALLQRDHCPANIGENLPVPHPSWIEAPAGSGFVAFIERLAFGDDAGLAVERAKAPTLPADPADILVGVAPAREFPIQNAGQNRAIDQVIAGAEIAVA